MWLSAVATPGPGWQQRTVTVQPWLRSALTAERESMPFPENGLKVNSYVTKRT